MAAPGPVVLEMNVKDYKSAKKIKAAVANMFGVERVWASPERRMVVVYGTADAWALRRRIRHKMKRRVSILSDGSTNYYGQGTRTTQYYDPPQPPAYGGYYSQPPPHAYYSQPPHAYYSQPPHAYYSHPPPPPPGYHAYGGGGYGGGWADPNPYGYAANDTVPWCSIM